MAVVLRRACKKYGNGEPVLDNLKLNVKFGAIYGLLGASGCGKTTLLNCLVGLKSLDSGTISMFNCVPTDRGIGGKAVGYMPQESTSLHPVFNIRETLYFYGSMYGMTKKGIEERTTFLAKLLKLPDLSSFIETLSGGQLRRVSFAVAMIHQPRLLILDEPTVGLDPLLRKSIWNHLTNKVMKHSRTTVIITTHYTEEAIACATIGVMRRGRVIVEDNPQALKEIYGCPNLGKTVLRICRQDEENLNNCNNEKRFSVPCVITHYPRSLIRKESMRRDTPSWRMHLTIILALVYKSFLLLRRNKIIMTGQLLLPLINIILYNNIVGTDPNGLKVGLVSGEWNNVNSSLDILSFCGNYPVDNKCLKDDQLSTICSLFNQFKKGEIEWISQQSDETALASIERGEAMAFFLLPTNFSLHLNNRLLYRNNADNDTLDGSTISVRMDMSNVMSNVWLVQRLLERYSDFVKGEVESCQNDPRVVEPALKFNALYGDYDQSTWIQFIQPFLIIYIMYILASLTAGVMALEKRMGILDRWSVAGVHFGHTVVATFISDSCIMFGQIGIIFSVLPTFYGMTNEGSWFLAMAMVYFACIGSLACGFVLAKISKNEMEVTMLLLFINAFNLISTGGIWPMESIHPVWRIVCQLLPPSLPIDGLRSILFRGWGLSHFKVWRGFAISFFYTFGAILVCLFLHRNKK